MTGAARADLETRLLTRLDSAPVADVAIPAVATPAVAAVADGLAGWDISRAEQVICWGGRLAALGLAQGCAEAGSVIREAGLFNLAVACFDTVVDELPEHLPLLARVLHPTLLARRLEGTADCLTTGARAGPLEAITQLFDASLEGTSRRVAAWPEQRRHLAELLRRMYDSETGQSPDPLPAKTLPVVYIGAISDLPGADPDRAAASAALFFELARFIADWDDYQDLAGDWLSGDANRFLRASTAAQRAGASFGKGLSRLLLARRSQAQLAEAVLESLNRVQRAAARAERGDEVSRLLTRLVSGRA